MDQSRYVKMEATRQAIGEERIILHQLWQERYSTCSEAFTKHIFQALDRRLQKVSVRSSFVVTMQKQVHAFRFVTTSLLSLYYNYKKIAQKPNRRNIDFVDFAFYERKQMRFITT